MRTRFSKMNVSGSQNVFLVKTNKIFFSGTGTSNAHPVAGKGLKEISVCCPDYLFAAGLLFAG